MNKNKIDVYNYSNYFVFAAILIVFGILGTGFLEYRTILSIINNGIPQILITFGCTFALLVGVIDMSVASIGFLSGVCGGLIIKYTGLPVWTCGLISIAIGAGLGYLNSVLFVKCKLNAMLVSLGMSLVLRAIGRILTQDNTVIIQKRVKAYHGARIGFLGGLQWTIVVLIVIIVACQLILKYTSFGRKLLLVGNDENVARRVGINVDKIKTLALVSEGILCGFAGAYWLIIQEAVVTTGLNNFEFYALAGACLGGTSLLGGRGSFFPAAVLGSLILLFLQAGISNIGLNIFYMPFVRGIVIFVAMYVDSVRTRKQMGNKL